MLVLKTRNVNICDHMMMNTPRLLCAFWASFTLKHSVLASVFVCKCMHAALT
jgi:hypothetical protein